MCKYVTAKIVKLHFYEGSNFLGTSYSKKALALKLTYS